jgi:Protein of unknown function (DUF3995)
MMILLALLNSLIFFLLGSIHIYWAVGGQWGLNAALPQLSDTGKAVFNPGRVACIVVALGLWAFAALFLVINLETSAFLPVHTIKWGTISVGIVFLLRAIGDFKYVGFTKTVKATYFAQMDTRWFSPLCLYLGLASLGIGYLAN